MNWQNWEINLNLIRCLGFLGCSEHTCRYLNAEGVAKERTFVTGSPMAKVLVYRRAQKCQNTNKNWRASGFVGETPTNLIKAPTYLGEPNIVSIN